MAMASSTSSGNVDGDRDNPEHTNWCSAMPVDVAGGEHHSEAQPDEGAHHEPRRQSSSQSLHHALSPRPGTSPLYFFLFVPSNCSPPIVATMISA